MAFRGIISLTQNIKGTQHVSSLTLSLFKIRLHNTAIHVINKVKVGPLVEITEGNFSKNSGALEFMVRSLRSNPIGGYPDFLRSYDRRSKGR